MEVGVRFQPLGGELRRTSDQFCRKRLAEKMLFCGTCPDGRVGDAAERQTRLGDDTVLQRYDCAG